MVIANYFSNSVDKNEKVVSSNPYGCFMGGKIAVCLLDETFVMINLHT